MDFCRKAQIESVPSYKPIFVPHCTSPQFFLPSPHYFWCFFVYSLSERERLWFFGTPAQRDGVPMEHDPVADEEQSVYGDDSTGTWTDGQDWTMDPGGEPIEGWNPTIHLWPIEGKVGPIRRGLLPPRNWDWFQLWTPMLHDLPRRPWLVFIYMCVYIHIYLEVCATSPPPPHTEPSSSALFDHHDREWRPFVLKLEEISNRVITFRLLTYA